jgi:eukaryotic-like serine/threonine-protein kinase
METRSVTPDKTSIYHYKVDKVLGHGGSGAVYRGIDTKSGQVVALKLFYANYFANRMHIRDLAKSVKAFRRFDHQNITKIYDYIDGKEGICLVEEYVDGPDLKWYMANRPWNLRERLVICAQVCNGLQYIHERGFLHHDLKPGNVLFTRKGIVKLTDYSLCRARIFSFLSSGIKDLVTPMYIAPELIKKEGAGPQSDIYSLGVTMYLMFAGRVPFEVDNLQHLYTCHLRFMPEHPSTVNPKCPHDLGDIIMRTLAKEPKERFRDCDQLRIAISDIGRSRI